MDTHKDDVVLSTLQTRIHDADLHSDGSLPNHYVPDMEASGLKHRPGAPQTVNRSEDYTEGSNTTGEPLTPTSSRGSTGTGRGSFLKKARISFWRFFKPSDIVDVEAKRRLEEQRLEKKYGWMPAFIREKPSNALKYPPGFPRMAAMTGDNSELEIFRRFKYVHIRLILQYEVETTLLEHALHHLDDKDAIKEQEATLAGKWEGPEYRLRRTIPREHRKDWDPTQTALMKELEESVLRYDQLIFNHAHHGTFATASEDAHSKYFHMCNYTNLDEACQAFLLHIDDFVSTINTRSNFAYRSVQNFLNKDPAWLENKIIQTLLRPSNATNVDGITPEATYFSDMALDLWVTAVLVTTCVGILLIPAILLFVVQMSHTLMAITASIFIFVCALFMSAMTDADPFKVFVGTATYAALVIMFLGNVNNNNSNNCNYNGSAPS